MNYQTPIKTPRALSRWERLCSSVARWCFRRAGFTCVAYNFRIRYTREIRLDFGSPGGKSFIGDIELNGRTIHELCEDIKVYREGEG
jgi:hypothetical protein